MVVGFSFCNELTGEYSRLMALTPGRVSADLTAP